MLPTSEGPLVTSLLFSLFPVFPESRIRVSQGPCYHGGIRKTKDPPLSVRGLRDGLKGLFEEGLADQASQEDVLCCSLLFSQHRRRPDTLPPH